MMIIAKLSGGLGNQMFQYAAGLSLSERLGTQFKIDYSFFEHQSLRKFQLSSFKIRERKSFNLENKLYRGSSYIYRLLRRFLNIKTLKEKKVSVFQNDFLSVDGNIYLDGYWQSEKYFRPASDKLRKRFSLRKSIDEKNNRLLKMIIGAECSVGIHVRRTDYVSNKNARKTHGLCTIDYYKKALNLIETSNKNLKCYVFSDDIDWCKNNLKIHSSTVFVEDNINSPEIDMLLMSACKHQIIANSSFSWWAAWLNKSKNKTVIAPKRWFASQKTNINHRFPKEWIKI